MRRTTADPGTVSHGTMRLEDLIPCFLACLDSLREECSLSDDRDADKHGKEDAWLGRLEDRMAAPGYFEREESSWDLDELFDRLDEYSPKDHYFGAHEGDGSDYGFWPSEEE